MKVSDDPESEHREMNVDESMLPLNRVIASAIRSCADEALSSRNRRLCSASILRSRTGARPRSGGGG